MGVVQMDKKTEQTSADSELIGAANVPPSVQNVVNMQKAQTPDKEGQATPDASNPPSTPTSNRPTIAEEKANSLAVLDKLPFLKNKFTWITAGIVGTAILVVSTPDIRNNVFEYLVSIGTPSLQQGEVKDPLWKIEMQKVSDDVLASIQRQDKQISTTLQQGIVAANAAQQSAAQARLTIQEVSANLSGLRDELSQVNRRMDTFEETLVDIASTPAGQVDLSPIESQLSGVQSTMKEIKKNALSNTVVLAKQMDRLAAVEKTIASLTVPEPVEVAQTVVTPEPAPQVDPVLQRQLIEKRSWKFRAATSKGNLASIYNTFTEQPLRVSIGMNAGRCGKVRSISYFDQQVVTEHCVITR